MKPFSAKYLNIVIAILVLVAVFSFGFRIGKDSQGDMTNTQATDSQYVTAEQFTPFWTAWRALNDKAIANASTTLEKKVWGAIEGLAASYGDPYTVFFPPQESKRFQENIAGNFGGVGMELGLKDGQLVVVAPIKGSPAAAAGVKTGDAILAINGTSTADMNVDQAVSYIRGPKGTTVKILFRPAGNAKTVERTIVRDTINIPTIDTSEKPGGIFVIKLYSFTAQADSLFREALRAFILSGDHKLILDLRGNPGGYLESSWDIASYFLPMGKVIVTEDFGDNREPHIYRSKGYNIFNSNLRMMILVDAGSASAAEILAGALQEQGVAKLVGVKTFGKGSVQELVKITEDTSLKVTIARWLTPQGHNLSHDGLVPDYEVKTSDADTAAGKDPVTDKAIELLNAQP